MLDGMLVETSEKSKNWGNTSMKARMKTHTEKLQIENIERGLNFSKLSELEIAFRLHPKIKQC